MRGQSLKRIGLVSAVLGALEPAEACFRDLWPGTERLVLYDEYLYELHGREQRLTDEMYERVRRLLTLSADSGVDAILFAGSLWGDCVLSCRDDFDIPVLTAYESLIEQALSASADSKLALLATVAGTITSFQADFERACDGKVELESVYVDQAMDELAAGNRTRHDELIVQRVAELSHCDTILLAQFSMQSVAPQLVQKTNKQILGSVSTAVTKLRALVDAQ